jgi:hypothetical protein
MARKPATDDAPVEILDDAGGPELGIDFGIVITTTLLLIGGLALIWIALAEHYGRGPLA